MQKLIQIPKQLFHPLISNQQFLSILAAEGFSGLRCPPLSEPCCLEKLNQIVCSNTPGLPTDGGKQAVLWSGMDIKLMLHSVVNFAGVSDYY